MPNTKIVATLGPASRSAEVLTQMFTTGVCVFRLNASHGTQQQHADTIRLVQSVAAEMKKSAALLLDLQGPKIRLGRLETEGCMLETGAEFVITTEPIIGNCQRASTTYRDFARDVKAGDQVLVADGTVELRAVESDGISVRLRVISGGPIGSNKGINLPGVRITTPSLTEKDIADLE